MYSIKLYNKISDVGLSKLNKEKISIVDDLDQSQAIILRSQSLHDISFPNGMLAIGRAGAGTNNVPVEECTKKGIVVFNAPGANANAVKELVLTGILLSTRDIVQAVEYVKSLKSLPADQIHSQVESGKSQFKGSEIYGKTLGVVGLGAIGMKVANDALGLGLNVVGYDPFLSVDHAWALSSRVKPVGSLNELLSQSDFVSFHMPLNKNTSNFVNAEILAQTKKGAVLLNFSREGIVDLLAMKQSLEDGQLAKYVTDFPSPELIGVHNVISTPHLGASTVQAEENCAIMIADQIQDFLLHGNIKNSVNFPTCSLPRMSSSRLVIANDNIPNMVGQITAVLANHSINIVEMVNKSKDTMAYNILELESEVSHDVIEEISAIDGVIFCRSIV